MSSRYQLPCPLCYHLFALPPLLCPGPSSWLISADCRTGVPSPSRFWCVPGGPKEGQREVGVLLLLSFPLRFCLHSCCGHSFRGAARPDCSCSPGVLATPSSPCRCRPQGGNNAPLSLTLGCCTILCVSPCPPHDKQSPHLSLSLAVGGSFLPGP